ncbi:MAG: ABC transporter permease, partial [Chloroflexi bacterium]|nr:ABC transporter permease [Chloroflexota bacterium]
MVVWTALSSLGANKLRTGLALLGVVIGVAAVISTMSVGRGAQQAVTANIEALGTNLLFIRSDSGAATLTLEDADIMIDAAERNGMQLAVNVKHSFEPRIQKVREFVRTGELGRWVALVPMLAVAWVHQFAVLFILLLMYLVRYIRSVRDLWQPAL